MVISVLVVLVEILGTLSACMFLSSGEQVDAERLSWVSGWVREYCLAVIIYMCMLDRILTPKA